MGRFTTTEWAIGATSLLTMLISFIILYSETNEPVSSFTGALLGASLMLGSLIVLLWLVRVFRK